MESQAQYISDILQYLSNIERTMQRPTAKGLREMNNRMGNLRRLVAALGPNLPPELQQRVSAALNYQETDALRTRASERDAEARDARKWDIANGAPQPTYNMPVGVNGLLGDGGSDITSPTLVNGQLQMPGSGLGIGPGPGVIGDPLGRGISIGSIGNAAAGLTPPPPSSAGASNSDSSPDGYPAFKAMFKIMTGRDITDEELSSNEFISTLDAKMIAKLPVDRLVGLSSGVLGKLDNAKLAAVINYGISHGKPDILTNFGADRLAQFDKGQIRLFTNYLGTMSDPASVTLAQQLNRVMDSTTNNGPSNPNNSGSSNNPSSTNNPTGNPVIPELHNFNPTQRSGSVQDLIGGGFQKDGLNEYDIDRLFQFDSDPEAASRNILAGYGFNTDVESPITEYLQSILPDQYQLAQYQNIVGGGAGKNVDVFNMLGSQQGFGGGFGGQGFQADLDSMLGKFESGGEGLTDAQRAFATDLMGDKKKQFALSTNFGAMPRNMRNSYSKLHGGMLQKYQNQAAANPNASYWSFLRGQK